ncbi:PadR family transcriptional regulator [Nocardioides hungaricus]
MSAALPLLALLEQEPAHGYTLKQRYDDRFSRTRPLAFGQVYAALSRFERNGWAEILDVEVAEGPERKRYRVTPTGVETVDAWVYSPQQPAEFAMSNLCTRVSVALTSGRSAAEVLDRQRTQHLARMRELTRQRADAGPAEQLPITYELAHLDADLRWIEEAGTRLEELR